MRDREPREASAELRLVPRLGPAPSGATEPPSLPGPAPGPDPALYGSSGLQVGANKALIDCPEGRASLPGRLLPSVPRQGFAGKGGGGGACILAQMHFPCYWGSQIQILTSHLPTTSE